MYGGVASDISVMSSSYRLPIYKVRELAGVVAIGVGVRVGVRVEVPVLVACGTRGARGTYGACGACGAYSTRDARNACGEPLDLAVSFVLPSLPSLPPPPSPPLPPAAPGLRLPTPDIPKLFFKMVKSDALTTPLLSKSLLFGAYCPKSFFRIVKSVEFTMLELLASPPSIVPTSMLFCVAPAIATVPLMGRKRSDVELRCRSRRLAFSSLFARVFLL